MQKILSLLGRKLSDQQCFIGAWRLVGLTFADGRPDFAMGESPIGYIIYTKDGIMSAQLMRTERTPFDPQNITLEEAKSALADFFAYAGPFEIDHKQKIVTHRVKTHLSPKAINKDLKRSYRFEGKRLYLTTIGNDKDNKTIIWERIG